MSVAFEPQAQSNHRYWLAFIPPRRIRIGLSCNSHSNKIGFVRTVIQRFSTFPKVFEMEDGIRGMTKKCGQMRMVKDYYLPKGKANFCKMDA